MTSNIVIIIFLEYFVFFEINALHLQQHQYWFNKDHSRYQGNDNRWNYCDYKCLYMQNYVQNQDFVVVVLKAPLRETFSVCYVKVDSDYTLWNKVIINEFYQQHCGSDDKDWLHQGTFDVEGIYAKGIGTDLIQSQIYKH